MTLIFLLLLAIQIWFGYRLSSKKIGDAFFLYYLVFAFVYWFRPVTLAMNLDIPFPERFFKADYSDDLIYSGGLAMIWNLFFIIGASFRFKLIPAALLFRPRPKINTRSFMICLIPFIMISLAVFGYLFSLFGFDIYQITRAVRISRILGGLTVLQHVPITVSYLATALVFALIVNKRKSRITIAFLIVVSIAFSIGSLLFGGRSTFVYYVVFSALGYNLFVRKVPIWALPIVAVATLSLISYLKDAREALWYDVGTQSKENIFRSIADSANLDSFDKFLLLLQSDIPLKYGSGFVNSIMAIVPRFIWPSKPANLYMDIEFHSYFEATTIGWPLKSFGEWYYNFGFLGMVLGGLIAGLIFRTIQIRYKDFQSNPYSYLFMFIFSIEVFQVGYYGVSPIFYIYKIVPIALFFLLIMNLSKLTRSLKLG